MPDKNDGTVKAVQLGLFKIVFLVLCVVLFILGVLMFTHNWDIFAILVGIVMILVAFFGAYCAFWKAKEFFWLLFLIGIAALIIAQIIFLIVSFVAGPIFWRIFNTILNIVFLVVLGWMGYSIRGGNYPFGSPPPGQ
eukprot:TRINITY_DN12715_c0_g1_i1.p1 TRINITY_DN12715_c0_g1~~TRINITY_DN12715_c0_g1_i1.p1  ORF type:complete len:154 (-),score=42.90 TRINITY_DN12715_c0_g1_i1:114-524(-)